MTPDEFTVLMHRQREKTAKMRGLLIDIERFAQTAYDALHADPPYTRVVDQRLKTILSLCAKREL